MLKITEVFTAGGTLFCYSGFFSSRVFQCGISEARSYSLLDTPALTEALPPPAQVLLPGMRTNLLVLRRGAGLEVKGRRRELGLGRLRAPAGRWRCLGPAPGRWLLQILRRFIEFTVFIRQNAPDCCAASERKHQTPVCTFRKPQSLEMS